MEEIPKEVMRGHVPLSIFLNTCILQQIRKIVMKNIQWTNLQYTFCTNNEMPISHAFDLSLHLTK